MKKEQHILYNALPKNEVKQNLLFWNSALLKSKNSSTSEGNGIKCNEEGVAFEVNYVYRF